MKRPSFQFYPADYRNNAKLRRCTFAARGAWIEVMGLLHDSDEYGILRWTLKEIAQAVGCPLALVKELVEKDVLKGSATAISEYTYTPVSGRKKGPTVTLIPAQEGQIWYCARMVRDEYVRQKKANLELHKDSPNQSPMGGMGEGMDDGPMPPLSDLPTSTASFSSSLNTKELSTPPPSPDQGQLLSPDGDAKDSGEAPEMDDKAIAFDLGVTALVRLGMPKKSAGGMVGKAIKETGQETAIKIFGRINTFEKHPNPPALVQMLIEEEKDPILRALRERHGEVIKLQDGRYRLGQTFWSCNGEQEVAA